MCLDMIQWKDFINIEVIQSYEGLAIFFFHKSFKTPNETNNS